MCGDKASTGVYKDGVIIDIDEDAQPPFSKVPQPAH
jgi:hypothetical protein